MKIRSAGHIVFVLFTQVVVVLAGLNVAGGATAVPGGAQIGPGNITTVSLPQGDTTLGIASQVGFVHSGTLGLIPAQSPDGSSTLFSFSMSTGQIAGSADLTADFGVFASTGSASQSALQYEYLQAFDSSGLVAVYGQDGAGNQKVVMFECDQTGILSRLWAQSFPAPPSLPSTPAVQFNSDGSRLYTYYTVTVDASTAAAAEVPLACGGALTKETGRFFRPLVWEGGARAMRQPEVLRIVNSYIVLVNSVAGSVSDTFQIPTTPVDAGAVEGLAFDVQSDRLVALVGASIYVFQDVPNQVSLTAKIGFVENEVGVASPIGIVGGRFLASYGGGPIKPGGNYFFCTDLEAGTSTSVFVPGNILPFANNMNIDQAASSILVPYSLILTVHGDDLDLVIGTRKFDTLSISSNGTIGRSSRTILPPSHTSATNTFKNGDNAIPSKSGAMCFLAVWSGNMFTVDAETGDVVNQMNLAQSPLEYLILDSATDQIVFNAGSSLEIIDAPDHPTISVVAVERSQTTITGANFLSGATVTINGVSVPLAPTQSLPSNVIIVGMGKADFPKGQRLAVVVTNRDGLSSNSFSFER
jgi:hypothetical protein